MGTILSVNVAVPRANPADPARQTGIYKVPVADPVLIQVPEARGSGVVGDAVFAEVHGGDDRAVYVYAREDLDWWEVHLGRTLPAGLFGENLTTTGIDVNGAVIGETWQIGPDLVVQATFARIPCETFQARMAEPRWVRRFTEQARPGTYLRVLEPGRIQAGDPVRIRHRPGHGVTIAEGFRAWTLEPELLPRLLEADELVPRIAAKARQRLG